MATLTSIVAVEGFFGDERPSNEKFTEQIARKVNTIIDNQNSINAAMNALLQGVDGGAEQASLVFLMSSAPDGWTQDLSFTTGSTIRVTDGVTLPSGASPTFLGAADGGAWTISGVSGTSDGDHAHGIESHTHSLSAHTHTNGGHTHTMGSHTHTIPSHTHTLSSDGLTTGVGFQLTIDSWNVLFGGGPAQNWSQLTVHTHAVAAHDHGGTTNAASPTAFASSNVTGSASPSVLAPSTDTSGTASSSTTSTDGVHSHTYSHDGTWRPKFFNSIICKKD